MPGVGQRAVGGSRRVADFWDFSSIFEFKLKTKLKKEIKRKRGREKAGGPSRADPVQRGGAPAAPRRPSRRSRLVFPLFSGLKWIYLFACLLFCLLFRETANKYDCAVNCRRRSPRGGLAASRRACCPDTREPRR